jgi:hypothetical protein
LSGEQSLENVVNQKKTRITVPLGEGTLAWIEMHKFSFGCKTVQEFVIYAIGKEIEKAKRTKDKIMEHRKSWGYEY